MGPKKKADGEQQEFKQQGMKILRKRTAYIPAKKTSSLGMASLETMKNNRQRPSLFKFTMAVLYKNLYVMGITLLRRRLRLLRRFRRFRSQLKGMAYSRLERLAQGSGRVFAGFLVRMRAPFLRIGRTYREVRPDIRAKRSQGQFPFAAYFAVLEAVARLIFKIFATIFNYTAPIAAVAFLIFTIQQGINRPMVFAVDYGGEIIGYIENEAVFTAAARDVYSRVATDGGSSFKILNPHYKLMTVESFARSKAAGEIPETAGYLTAADIADKLIESFDSDAEEAYGLYIDNEFLGAVRNKDPVLDEFARIKRENMTGKPDEKMSFVKSIRLKPGLYLKDSITSDRNILSAITRNETADEIYIVQQGDTPTGIADKTGIPYEALKELNPDIEEDLFEGMKIYTKVARPFLSVETTYTDIVEEELAYETIEVQNATYAVGYRDVFQEGVNGLRRVTYRVSSVNGFETERVELESVEVKASVPERVTVGVNNPAIIKPSWPPQTTQPGQPSTQTPTPTPTPAPNPGGFIWPVGGTGGYISYGLNGYWGHTGIDIVRAGGRGTPILAAASGTVVVSKSNIYGYGRHIVIDHGNGYQTYYAHNSALYVSVGDRVAQGQVIAAMGDTGNAFGVHLHFEVRQNGRVMNPVNYVGRR